MDQRGIGRWNMSPLKSTEDAIWALDADEAGKNGMVRDMTQGKNGCVNVLYIDRHLMFRCVYGKTIDRKDVLQLMKTELQTKH
jgi:hypothetical protein